MNTIEIIKKDDDSYDLIEDGKVTADLSRAGVWATIHAMLLQCPRKGRAVITVDTLIKGPMGMVVNNPSPVDDSGPINIPGGGCGW